MTDYARECLERAEYCTQLAEVENDPKMKAYLAKLASSWTRAAHETMHGMLEGA